MVCDIEMLRRRRVSDGKVGFVGFTVDGGVKQ